jgi:hypothetical protein
MSQSIQASSLVPAILALQFVTFGWRINREISLGDSGRKVWLPVPDVLNVLSLFAVVAFCIVVPLGTHSGEPSRSVVAAAFVLLAFHPLSMAFHYSLFSNGGRDGELNADDDYQYCPMRERVSVAASVALALIAAYFVA